MTVREAAVTEAEWSASADDLRGRVRQTLERGRSHLESRQNPDGSWTGDYGGPMFLLPMFIFVCRFAKRAIPQERAERMVLYFRNSLNGDGSVGLYQGGPGTIFTSALVYAALRLLGVSPREPTAARLAGWVRERGGPLAAASWGKFALSLVDLYSYDGLDPLLPELWLLPYGVPFHPGRMWCHARQVYLPMSWLYGRRAHRPADALIEEIRRELYSEPYQTIDFRAARGRTAQADRYRDDTPWLALANRLLALYERFAPRRLRERALNEVWKQLAFEDAATNFIRIGPVNAVLNTACHYDRDPGSPEVERSFAALEHYLWDGNDGLKMQGYNSTALWDTTFALQSLLAIPKPSTDVDTSVAETATECRVVIRAGEFVRDNQILDDVPETARHYRHASRGGWPFSNRPHGWPITDCTAEGLKCALATESSVAVPEDLLHSAVDLLLSFQNGDGGWATYERQRAGGWLELFNPSQVFGDIMVDYSFPECTSAVVQALVRARRRFPEFRERESTSAVRRGVEFLRRSQRPDGSWEGSWGVCFTYGTWFGVSGLRAAGVPTTDPALRSACEFLLERQHADGSWGEQPASCARRQYVDHPVGQVVMTSWALLSLVRAEDVDHEAQSRAVRFLVERQSSEGSWPRESWAGVFNRTCMINYDNYRLYFPVWALGEWLQAADAQRRMGLPTR